jgi:uncharacterized protein YggU (UPF0235/DUF167 family)
MVKRYAPDFAVETGAPWLSNLRSWCWEYSSLSRPRTGTKGVWIDNSGRYTSRSVSFKLAVKVVPGSSRSGIAGWLGDTLRVRVTASPERGKANKAVEALLSEVLALPSGGARIVAGESSPRKTVEIIGISESEIRRRLSDAVPGGLRS